MCYLLGFSAEPFWNNKTDPTSWSVTRHIHHSYCRPVVVPFIRLNIPPRFSPVTRDNIRTRTARGCVHVGCGCYLSDDISCGGPERAREWHDTLDVPDEFPLECTGSSFQGEGPENGPSARVMDRRLAGADWLIALESYNRFKFGIAGITSVLPTSRPFLRAPFGQPNIATFINIHEYWKGKK